MSLNNLFDTNEDSDDDNEDDDYKPENEVLSDNSGSEEEVDETDGHKTKSKKLKKIDEEVEDNDKSLIEDKLTAKELKQKTDSIWDEFRKDVSKAESKVVSDNGSTHTTNDSSIKTTVTKTYDFAGEEVTVTEEVANTSKTEIKADKSDEKNIDNQKQIPQKAIKRTGGLGSVLNQLKKPKISTLQKSFIDWKDFKKTEGIEEELDQQNRSKNSFIERQAFLQRTDLRQFEIEKQIREKNRSQRQLSKD